MFLFFPKQIAFTANALVFAKIKAFQTTQNQSFRFTYYHLERNYNYKLIMLGEDIAQDNLRSCSQNTFYLFEWTESINNRTPHKIVASRLTKISSQFPPQTNSRKELQSKKSLPQIQQAQASSQRQSTKNLKQLREQKQKQVLCRFEYPIVDQTQFASQQHNYWSKNRRDLSIPKKQQSLGKLRSHKNLSDLVQIQIKKLKITNPRQKIKNKLIQSKLRQHIIIPTHTLPSLSNKTFKMDLKEQGYKPILIDTSSRQQSPNQRHSSMPAILKNNTV